MYLQTMGSELEELGRFKFPSFKVPIPKFPKPPRMPSFPRPPAIKPPRVTVKAPTIKAPKAPTIKAPKAPTIKIDTGKIGKKLSEGYKSFFTPGLKQISQGLESVFKNFAPPSPGEMDQQPQENFQDNEMFEVVPQSNFTSNEFLPVEEPVELTEQESEEMLGALSQGQAGLLNTGFSLASSFIPGLSMAQPMAQNLLSQAQKKPAKKPNPLQLLAQLQKKPVQPVARPVARPVAKPTTRAVEEKKSDNTLLIIGGVGILAILMMTKKK